MPEPTEDLRSALEESFEKHSAPEPEPTPEPQAGGSTPDTTKSLGDTPPAEGSTATEPTPPNEGRVRGPDGKFAPKAVEAPVAAPVVTPPELEKAPQSWTPAEREAWNKVPSDARAAIMRREQEIQRGLSQSAVHRKFANDFHAVIKPYENLIRAQNSHPLQAVQNLMQTAAALTTGSAQQKAMVVREIMQNYGVDVEALDAVLTGQPIPERSMESHPATQLFEQRIAPIEQFVGTLQQRLAQQQQKMQEETQTEIQQFAATADFFEDVREDMADLMEAAANRGRNLTLKDAYERACAINPEVSAIVSQRRNAQAAQQKGNTVIAARQAAGSLKAGSPASVGPVAGSKGNLRADLEAAFGATR